MSNGCQDFVAKNLESADSEASELTVEEEWEECTTTNLEDAASETSKTPHMAGGTKFQIVLQGPRKNQTPQKVEVFVAT
jgi:hypothetical protein